MPDKKGVMAMGHVKFDFSGHVVAVTGAAGGIGKGIALGFAQAGASVVIGDLKAELGHSAVEEIRSLGGQARFVQLDVTDQQSTEAFIHSVQQESGRFDILVNGAGVANRHFGNPFTDLPDSDFDLTYNVNVKGVAHTCRAVYPIFRAQGNSRILNIASTVGHSTNTFNVPYAVSKAAVLNLTTNLAKELGVYGVTVNALCPGYIYTPMYEAAAPGIIEKSSGLSGMNARELVAYFAKMNCATQREQYVEDIANAALFLASEAASNITGVALDVAGGYKL